MAGREKKMNLTENEGVLGVIISRDEYREYEELKAKRDRSEASMRARMQTQNQEVIDFAKFVKTFFDENLSALAIKGALRIYDRAKEIIEE